MIDGDVRRRAWTLICGMGVVLAGGAVQAQETDMTSKPEVIVFLGDSITQAGDRPGGYVDIIRQQLAAQRPQAKVIGAGISGNKVPDLQRRLERDVLAHQPTTVVIYIGINDVWHSQNGRGTPLDLFETGLRDIIQQIQDAGAQVILATPSVIGEKTGGTNPLDAMLQGYSQVSREVAKSTGAQLLDLRKRFIAYLQENNPENQPTNILTTDGVHLNPAGNKFVAQQMLEGLKELVSDGVATTESPRLLRHIVMFKFVNGLEQEKIDEVVAEFSSLEDKIDSIIDYEYGTNNSEEGMSGGFTHCFTVTFRDEAGRDAYLPHPAHREFVKLLAGRIDDVLVFDYWTR